MNAPALPGGVPWPGSPEKKQQSKDAQKVLRLLAHPLGERRFLRTKPSFFIRRGPLVVEFIHIHKFTFGPSFRVHAGIRATNDDFDAVHLNGPHSDGTENPRTPGLGYQFPYGPNRESFEACTQAMLGFIDRVALPWLESVRASSVLLSAHSPLSPRAKEVLRIALREGGEPVISTATQSVLNVT